MRTLLANSSRVALALSVAGAALVASTAHAQEAQAQGESDQATSEEIVVTGTILRGAAPTGSNLISVGEDRIASQGATSSNELLATVPQVSNLFNNVPNARLALTPSNQVQVVRPNLRNLSDETASSASTLVLFDGHRISPVGVTQNAVDPDLIPTLAIERVEVVTDGGSATYGADAVGGVINFITRKRFDGVKVSARYGFADEYHQVDAGAIIGKDWGSGSLFAAYNYQHNDAIFGRDRDYIRDVDWLSPNLTPRGRSCTPGNVQIGVTMFALPALGPGANACDPTDDSTFVPISTRHGAIGGLHQELADWLTVDVRAFYGERRSTSLSPFRGSVNLSGASSPGFTIPGVITIPPSFRSFYYTPVPGQSPTANQTVLFTFAPLLGTNTQRSRSSFEEWGANAEFTAELGDNWGLRTLLNYSRSNSEFHLDGLNQGLLTSFANGQTAATAINFYNPSASDLPLIQQLINNENAGQGREELFNGRAIVDGTLFTLPGGDVKLAAGYEFIHDAFRQRVSTTGPIGTIRSVPFTPYSRNINSVFGEVQVPIVGADNRMGFIYSLTLSGSVRYDHFSDVGGTTNPKIGVNFKPVNWLGLRGNYSTSFNAPSPVDQLGSLRNSVTLFPFIAFLRPGDVPTVSGTIGLQGSNPGLRPQTAKTWSVGIDIDPPFVDGLHATVNYYNVKFKNIITQPSPTPTIFGLFPNNITSNANGLTLAQVTSFLNASGAPQAGTVLGQVTPLCNSAGVCNVYELVDFRQGNYGRRDIQGLDFSANYRTDTGFGGVDASVSGNYQIKRKTQTGVGAPVINELSAFVLPLPGNLLIPFNGTPRLQLQGTLGADVGNFRAQVTVNHTSGFRVVRCDPTTVPACNLSTTGIPTSAGLPQDRVKSFNTVNLFFKYDVPGDSLFLKDLEFTVNVNNVFDQDPPVFRQIGSPTPGFPVTAFTLGRLVQFGVSKAF